jgi:F-type H+-transporting ATPase subunit b
MVRVSMAFQKSFYGSPQMISIGLDQTLFIQIVQFLLIVCFVNFLIAKPIRKTMLSREAKIQDLQEKAKSSLEAIEAKKADYDNKLREVKAEIARYQEELKSEASAKASAMLEKVKSETNAEIEKARAVIAAEVEKARAALGGETAELKGKIIELVTK